MADLVPRTCFSPWKKELDVPAPVKIYLLHHLVNPHTSAAITRVATPLTSIDDSTVDAAAAVVTAESVTGTAKNGFRN